MSDNPSDVPRVIVFIPDVTASKPEHRKPAIFKVGSVFATPGAVDALKKFNINPVDLLQRHMTGDWGDVDIEDGRTNDLAVHNFQRILSSYRLEGEGDQSADTSERLWIVTEWNRSVTTLLLNNEY